jgi:hypothetical protein
VSIPSATSDPAQRRRSGLVVAVVLVVLAGAVFAAFKIHDALKSSPKPDTGAATLHLPTSFSGFAVAKDPDSATLRARITAGSTSSTAPAERGVQTQLYINPGGHRVFVVGVSAHDNADTRGLLRSEPHETTLSDAMIGYKVIGATDIPTTPYSGVMRCGLGVYGGNRNTPVCIWVDDDTYVTVLDVSIAVVGGTALTATDLASAATALRAQAESTN